MGTRIKTLHVVGYKNSGKTTLLNRWISFLKKRGLSIVVIKHHGHGAKLAMPDEGKDSVLYLLNGADASLVAGGGKTQYMLNKALSYAQLHYLASIENPDFILVEGYKEEDGEKVILLNDEKDWETLSEVEGTQLVIGNLTHQLKVDQITSRENGEELDEWIWSWWQAGT